MGAIISAIVAAFLEKLFGFFGARLDKADSDAAHERAAVSEAEAETEDVVAEIADERSRIASGGSADDIAARLRARIVPGAPGGQQNDDQS